MQLRVARLARRKAEIAMKHRGSPIVAMHGKIGTLAALTEGLLPPETGSQGGDLDEEGGPPA
jgi:hypothetical protein